MSDLGAASEPVHRSGDSVAAVWPHSGRMVRAAWMEKIMSKTGRQLEDSELELVSGGTVAEEGLKAAAAEFNMLVGVLTTLINAQGAALNNAAQKA